MKLYAKNLAIQTGGPKIAIIHENTAYQLGIKNGDRVVLTYNKNKTTAVIDTTTTLVIENEIGLFSEVQKVLKSPQNKKVSLAILPKPAAVFHIQKKVHGGKLTPDEMRDIVYSITHNELTEVEMTYFVSACYHNELNESEIVSLAQAMIDSGTRLTFKSDKPILDKHCIGGVPANRTTAVVVPILAAAGYLVPKTSSRSITSPAGTSDTMEVMTHVTLTAQEVIKVVNKVGACMVWGGGLDLAPADDKIIRIEHPMSLDPTGQLIASVLSKKASVGASHVLIDIPYGKGAKIETKTKALELQSLFERIGKKLNLHVKAVLTDGTQPIGNGIGPGLEARDILWTLQNHKNGSQQLKQKAIKLATILLTYVGEKNAKQIVTDIFESGQAYKKFQDILIAQGAKCIAPEKIKIGTLTHKVKAASNGVIVHMDNKELSRISRLSGAPHDIGAGVYLHAHKKDSVKKGDALYTIYAESKEKLNQTILYVKNKNGILIR